MWWIVGALIACGPKQPVEHVVGPSCTALTEVAAHTDAALSATRPTALRLSFLNAQTAVNDACEPLSPTLAADFLLAHARVMDGRGTKPLTRDQKAALLGVIWAAPTYHPSPVASSHTQALLQSMSTLRKAPTFGALQTLDSERGTWFVNGVRTPSLPTDIEAIIQLQTASSVYTVPRDDALKMLAESTVHETPPEGKIERMRGTVSTAVGGTAAGILLIGALILELL